MTKKYDASSIQVLEGLEAVRLRPAMYIGDTSVRGLHHCVFEVVDNAVDEALAGHCDRVEVTIHQDGSITVSDNGRGIPVDVHKEEGVPAVEVILCKLHAGGKFDDESYKISGGLHGVGVSCVNALAEWLSVKIEKDGKAYEQSFARGEKTNELTESAGSGKTGTSLTFKPDGEIFETLEFSYEYLSNRLRELAFLMGRSGLQINIQDERDGKKDAFSYPGGLEDFVDFINDTKEPLHEKVITIKAEAESSGGPVEIEVALQYNGGYREDVYTFVNNINTTEGGTHLSGFRAGLTRALNAYAKKSNLVKAKEATPSGEDFREGLAAIVSVKLSDPQFESQTKIKLGNHDIEGILSSAVFDRVGTALEESPAVGKAIVTKALLAARAREAARKQRDLVRRKGALASGNLPGKLADCQMKGREGTELFVVEGDSAGGTAKMARDRRFQAVLPLRGKILNVEKARLDKILNHQEIQILITALGTGLDDTLGGEEGEFDLENLRYDKIIIMTDADVDGSHIRTLLLTFLFRKMRPLVEEGKVYIAAPPLFKVKGKKEKPRYLLDERALQAELLQRGVDRCCVEVGAGGARIEGEALATFIEHASLVGRINDQFERAYQGLTVSELVAWSKKEEAPDFVVVGPDGGRTLCRDKKRATAQTKKEPLADLLEFHDGEAVAAVFKAIAEAGLNPAQSFPPEGEVSFTVESEGEDDVEARSLLDVLDLVRGAGEKGVDIQRYKGLGEMNDDQLWESTMNPETRTLNCVTLSPEGGAAADVMFSKLMGPEVEPRRQYIQDHALEVRNLDV